MATPRLRSNDLPDEPIPAAPAPPMPTLSADMDAGARDRATVRTDVYGEMDDTDDRPAPTISEVMALMTTYLLAQYPDSLTDQEAVRDAARMAADGHVIPAWRHLARMIDGVLNVPPGG